MKLSTFKILNTKTQLFITTHHKKEIESISVKHVLEDHTPSLVGILDKSCHVIKFIRARTWHEYLKLLWNHSRITKEVRGSILLKSLGLKVPHIYEVGYGVIPSPQYEYIGYYIMENLTPSGFTELSKLIREELISEAIREEIMLSVLKGLKQMRDNNIVFSDFHLDNIFANKYGDIIWIDTGVTKYSSFRKKKFRLKHNHSINRFKNYKYDKKELLSYKEKLIFNQLLILP